MSDKLKSTAASIAQSLSSPKTGPDYNQDDATDNDGSHAAMEEFITAVHAGDAAGAHEAMKSYNEMQTDSENEDDSQEGEPGQAPSDKSSEEY